MKKVILTLALSCKNDADASITTTDSTAVATDSIKVDTTGVVIDTLK